MMGTLQIYLQIQLTKSCLKKIYLILFDVDTIKLNIPFKIDNFKYINEHLFSYPIIPVLRRKYLLKLHW